MELIVIAAQVGVTPAALDRFITSGEVPTTFAARLNTTQSSLQDFIDGGSSIGLAMKITCTPSAVEKPARQSAARARSVSSSG